MKQIIYFLRDKVALSFVRSFDASNDAVAVRHIVDAYGKQPHFSDLELWRSSVAYDVETGDISSVEKCVVALPPVPVAPPVDQQLNGVKQV